jgi:hypothetical protein
VFAMARDRTRVADACWGVLLSGGCWCRVARKACIEALAERAEIACAGVELLHLVSQRAIEAAYVLTYGRASRASASRLSCSLIKLVVYC